MLTAEAMLAQAQKPTEYECPKCGHHGPMPVYRLPGVTVCTSEKKGTHYEVHIPGEESPRVFMRPPSEDEIRTLVEEAKAKARAKPQQQPKGKE